jgi:hypothetical protein
MHVHRFGFRRKKNKDKQLPQELQMKVDRGGALPPGWQRKLVKRISIGVCLRLTCGPMNLNIMG